MTKSVFFRCTAACWPLRNGCMHLAGVKVDLPVLAPNDIADIQKFAVKNKMDFVAASFVQSGEDVK